jgi:hypothetical protein
MVRIEVWSDVDDEQCDAATEAYLRKKVARSADWKVFAEDVLEKIDEQLAVFGLEICQHETGGDYYEWYIDNRVAGTSPTKSVSPEDEWFQRLNIFQMCSERDVGPGDLE